MTYTLCWLESGPAGIVKRPLLCKFPLILAQLVVPVPYTLGPIPFLP